MSLFTLASAASIASLSVFTSGADGFDTNTVFLDTGSEVVAFDAQFTPALAEQALSFLAKRTQSPVTHVVVTHPNPDKFGGVAAFQARGAKVVASQATAAALPSVHAYKKAFFVDVAKMFTSETFPALPSVDSTFETTKVMTLKGGTRIELTELGRPGVSGNQTVAYLPAQKALVVGDLVHHGVHAWMEGSVAKGTPEPTLASWASLLDSLAKRYPADTMVYGGRGKSVVLKEAVRAQKEYLVKADALVTRYVADLGNKRAELFGAQAGAHFAALTKTFEAAFPGLGHPSLVTYGVYGLALSKAK
ncbi:MAG: MBL fold metallo-hydrolase [Silvanigrellales bacterium]|jgi:glyoxylase-like metal-dependent hydrolase (beta-lactamase superfamily II)|nr:MBL fold metallo-hydrolase [Silvanigrellales bacterium]